MPESISTHCMRALDYSLNCVSFVNLKMSPYGLALILLLLSVMWVWGCISCHHKDGAKQQTDQILVSIKKAGVYWQHLRRELGSFYIIPRQCVLGFPSKISFHFFFSSCNRMLAFGPTWSILSWLCPSACDFLSHLGMAQRWSVHLVCK